jgi:hypothetical protein
VIPVHRLWIGLVFGAVFIGSAVGTDIESYDVALATNREVQELTGFTSPSRNIGCYIEPGYVRCDVRDRAWSPPPKAADCPDYTGWGQGLQLKTGVGAGFVCAGDTALDGGPALPYGDEITAGSIECRSEVSGMSCRDLQDGHEFSISRDGYQIH